MEFDYVIVGGGSAGCVLAARLSENPAASVVLIEAGGRDHNPLYHWPAGFAYMTRGIGSWGWNTTPQKHMGGKIFRFTQAKVIGGGSSINAQIYTRGARQDYDGWRQMGCIGWGSDDVLPYFKKAEDNDSFADEFHGVGGPLGVSQPRAPLPICEAFFEAAQSLGIPRNHDVNGVRQDGVGFYQLTQRHGRRCSAATAYLKAARGRKNLHIMTRRQVRRIKVEGGRAIGVELESGGVMAARCEVIIACGAVGTPRLLQLSGIGDGGHLRALGIATLCQSPHVGRHFQDHLDLYAIAELRGAYSYDRYAQWHHAALALVHYLATRSGPVASSLFETGGFWYADPGDNPGADPGDDPGDDPGAGAPDLQMHLGLGTGIEHGVMSMPEGGITLNSCYLRPRSRGSVMLASADPRDAPLIDPNYLEDARDKVLSLEGLKLTRRILAAPALRPFVKEERLPGRDVGADVGADEGLFDYICRHAKTAHHPAGTARMGAGDDSVVDIRLRLRGLDGLRIADNSIMPRLISSNTNAAAMMIAEKAADMIKQDRR